VISCNDKQLDGIGMLSLAAPAFSIAGNLVVLDRLRCRQKPGVECLRVGILVHDLLAFIDDAFDGVALLAARGLAQHLEDLLQPRDLAFSLVKMLFEGSTKLIRIGGPRRLRQGFHSA
jgi:hypothetical protein